MLSAGAGIPADCRLLQERDLSLNEAALTGESFPVSKHPMVVQATAPPARRSNVLFLGTHLVSGSGTAVVVRTGAATQFAAIAERLRQRSPEADFERGVRRFGALLLELTLVLVITIFAVNVILKRPVVDSFLFALALGVGLAPQLLPAIIRVNLAQGARRMAARRVIVKRLSSIENFGSLSVLGLLALADPLRPGVKATVAELARLGVRLKMITGDNALVAARVGREAGLRNPEVLTGTQMQQLSDSALPVRAEQVDVFAEIEPSQKERLIHALRRSGHVVGYLGDGINDAPALHAANVGLSVQGAVDVVREAAEIVLLDPDPAVLLAGIREGRRTFANTLKYVFMATSANFGNMVSMAVASLALPLSAAVAQADPAHQPAHRSAGDDHRLRPGGS